MTHPFEQHWTSFDRNARQAFRRAYMHSREQGSGRIRTRSLFGALIGLNPPSLAPLLEDLPDRALPDPVPADDERSNEDLSRIQPDLSPCVRTSVRKLGSVTDESEQRTALDVFVDLARHGAGSTVSTMRATGVTADHIEELLRKNDLSATDRNGSCGPDEDAST